MTESKGTSKHFFPLFLENQKWQFLKTHPFWENLMTKGSSGPLGLQRARQKTESPRHYFWQQLIDVNTKCQAIIFLFDSLWMKWGNVDKSLMIRTMLIKVIPHFYRAPLPTAIVLCEHSEYTGYKARTHYGNWPTACWISFECIHARID